jgi:hypothetical protein
MNKPNTGNVLLHRKGQAMTATQALKSPATRRLVHEVLALAETRDIVDAIHDLEHAVAVLHERMESK